MGYEYDADKNVLQNDIKKALYKEKPIANCIHRGHHTWIYYCYLNNLFSTPYKVNFTVPVSDMGSAEFGLQMEAQLLIRWIEL